MVKAPLPPKAPRWPIIGNSIAYLRDPLAFLRSMPAKYGDVVRVALGPLEVTLVSHPDLVEQILVTHNKSYQKDSFMQNLRPVLGEGLLSSEGDFWRRQRRLAQPAFHRDRIAAYAGIMVEYAARLGGTWRDGAVRDVHKDMMRLTLEIVAKTLFGADVGERAEDVGEALEAILEVFSDPLQIFVPFYRHLPLPSRRRFPLWPGSWTAGWPAAPSLRPRDPRGHESQDCRGGTLRAAGCLGGFLLTEDRQIER